MTGTATNGTDYTNLTGTATFKPNQLFTNIFIEPLADDEFEDNETVAVTLTGIGDGYFINPAFASASLTITDNIPTNIFQKIATLPGPVGIDYHQPSNSLIVSVDYTSGQPSNFVRFYTNVISTNVVSVITNWSPVRGVPEEVKLVAVKTTGSGFTTEKSSSAAVRASAGFRPMARALTRTGAC